jgi:TnpA family transposase
MYSVATHKKVMLQMVKDRALQLLQVSLVMWLTIYVASERGGIR